MKRLKCYIIISVFSLSLLSAANTETTKKLDLKASFMNIQRTEIGFYASADTASPLFEYSLNKKESDGTMSATQELYYRYEVTATVEKRPTIKLTVDGPMTCTSDTSVTDTVDWQVTCGVKTISSKIDDTGTLQIYPKSDQGQISNSGYLFTEEDAQKLVVKTIEPYWNDYPGKYGATLWIEVSGA